MGRIYGYARYAGSHQFRGKGSVDYQIDQFVDHVVAKGVELENVFADHVSSGNSSPLQRAGFADLACFLKPGDVVLVTRLDRLGRSPGTVVEAMRIIDQAGGSVVSIATEGAEVMTWVREIVEAMAVFLRSFERLEQVIRKGRTPPTGDVESSTIPPA